MSEKIGMCCSCGDYCNSKTSILSGGMEYCRRCFELYDITEDADDEDVDND